MPDQAAQAITENNSTATTTAASPATIKRSKPLSTIKIPVGGSIKVEEPQEDLDGPEQETFGEAVYTKEDVLKAWESFASKKKALGKDSEYHVLQQKLEFPKDYIIQINLINKLQEDIINKMRTDLMHYIRKTLNNGLIDLKIKIEEKQEQRMLYTHREKLEYLQEKKPIIKMLRDRLGLDPEF